MLFDLASSIAFSNDILACADVSVLTSRNVPNRNPDSHREQRFFAKFAKGFVLNLSIEFFIFFNFYLAFIA
ncbi:hypothetical protein D3C85_1363570 [compost metagenome]